MNLSKKELQKIWKKYSFTFKVLFILITIICFTLLNKNYSSSGDIDTKTRLIKNEDYRIFVEKWNDKVYELKMNPNRKYDSSSWDKYILKNEYTDISNKLSNFLKFEDKYLVQLAQMKKEKFSDIFYLPVVLWIQNRNKITYKEIKSDITQSGLNQEIAKIVEDKWFSPNTVDKIIQLNEFCYFFEKNKIDFIKNGFSKSITECQQIQQNLDKNNIDFKVY